MSTEKTEVTDWLSRTIGVFLVLGLLVWVAITLTRGTSFEKEVPRAERFSPMSLTKNNHYRKIELQLTTNWTDRIPIRGNESFYTWLHTTPGVEVETEKGVVSYGPGQRLGQVSWVRFRVKEGSGIMSICVVPRGDPATVCR